VLHPLPAIPPVNVISITAERKPAAVNFFGGIAGIEKLGSSLNFSVSACI
jgi:hypothetical protein